jgi:polyisoprenoid-binding protein YceI
VILAVVPEKSEARYRVREQLAGVSLPSDAIGRTNAISGQIVGKMDGTIVSAESEIVVDLRTLQSDQGMRDGFIQRSTLQTSRFPNATFVPTSAPGLPLIPPVPTSGDFQLIGDLTIRDVTKPVTWQASCTLESGQTEGTCSASTSFTFDEFELEQPRVGRVVSIEDTITLEVDLFLQRINP